MNENKINTECVYPRGIGRASFNIITLTETIINSIKNNVPIVYYDIESSTDIERMRKMFSGCSRRNI